MEPLKILFELYADKQRILLVKKLLQAYLDAMASGKHVLAAEVLEDLRSLADSPCMTEPLRAELVRALKYASHDALSGDIPDSLSIRQARLETWVPILIEQGARLIQDRQFPQAAQLLARTIAWLEKSPAFAMRDIALAAALYNRAMLLGSIGKLEEERHAYDDLLARFSCATDVKVQHHLAMALYNKGLRQNQLGRLEDAIRAYSELIRRFHETSQAEIQLQVAMALYNRGGTLGMLNQPQAELQDYDELIRRFGNAKTMAIRVQVAQAFGNMAAVLGQLGRHHDLIVICDELISRFGNETNEQIRQVLDRAREYKQIALSRLGSVQ